MKIYLVGGAVRDILLGKKPNDYDYCVVGSSKEEMIQKGYKLIGHRFPVFTHPETKSEYALARIEKKTGNSYKDFEVIFDPSTTLSDDLFRRDLTINAIAYDEELKTYIDPYNGINDIKEKTLRHVSNHFIEDPFRIVRLARFQAKFADFSIFSETFELSKKLVTIENINILTDKRLFVEFRKAFSEKHPFLFFKTLNDLGFFKLVFNNNLPDQYTNVVHDTVEKELAYLLFLYNLSKTKYDEILKLFSNNKLINDYYMKLNGINNSQINNNSLYILTQKLRLDKVSNEDLSFFERSLKSKVIDFIKYIVPLLKNNKFKNKEDKELFYKKTIRHFID